MAYQKYVVLGTPHPYPCPDCGARLLLTYTTEGVGYICEMRHRTGCQGNAGAHSNGEPMGKPGTERERTLRNLAHDLFDQVWLPQKGDKAAIRNEMITFMKQEMVKAGKLGPEEEFHFSTLDEDQLGFALRIIQGPLRQNF